MLLLRFRAKFVAKTSLYCLSSLNSQIYSPYQEVLEGSAGQPRALLPRPAVCPVRLSSRLGQSSSSPGRRSSLTERCRRTSVRITSFQSSRGSAFPTPDLVRWWDGKIWPVSSPPVINSVNQESVTKERQVCRGSPTVNTLQQLHVWAGPLRPAFAAEQRSRGPENPPWSLLGRDSPVTQETPATRQGSRVSSLFGNLTDTWE